MHEFKSKFEELTDFHLDALKEVGNIGAGHAAIALTQFLNRSTYMSIPSVAVDKISSISNFLNISNEKECAIISSKTISGLLYTLLVFIDDNSVRKIIDLMTESKSEIINLNDISPLFKSLIKEIGSILLLKYIEALNYFLKSDSFPIPPVFRFGTVNTINENELNEFDKKISSLLLIQCDIFTSEKNIQAGIAIIPHEETFSEFISSLS